MRSPRKGGVAVFVAVSLVLLLGFVALVVDLGVVRVVHAQLQAGADAAALSGAAQLNGTDDGLVEARDVTVGVAALNDAFGDPIILPANAGNLPSGAVVLGRWDPDAGALVPTLVATEVDAVQVIARHDDVASFFARVAFGRDRQGAAARSIAWAGGTQGAAEVPYYLPFGLPSCLWDGYTGDALMDMDFVLSPAGSDNTGWAMLGESTSTSSVRDHIDAMLPCMFAYAQTGEVDPDCAAGSIDDGADLNNGVAAAALAALADAVEDGLPWDSETWGTLPPRHAGSNIDVDRYGHVLEGPIPVFAGGPGYCGSAASWNEQVPILGFVWAAIYDVRQTGSAAQKNVWLRIDMSTLREIGTQGGGGDYGVTAPSPAVVVR